MITKNDNSTYKLTLIELEYSVIQEIKRVISEVAKSKDIPINLD